MPGAVARGNQSDALGFFLDPRRADGHSVRTGLFMQNGCCRYWFEKPPGAVTEGSVNRSEAGCGVRVGRESNGETCRGAMMAV